MPALPTVVTDYLTAIKTSLQTGTALGSNVQGAALNYLRAQDMATVLDLLQDAMDQSATMTVVDGTTLSFQDGVQATQTLTFTGVAVNTQTVTIGTKVYTWEDSLTNVDGNVLIGTAAQCVANLVAAIMLTGTPGTDYALLTTANTDVTAVDGTGDVVDITAIISGTVGQAIALAEDGTNTAWTGGDVFMSGGIDAFGPNELVDHLVVFAAATTTVALRGVEARIVANTAGQLSFGEALPGTPVAGDTYTIRGGWFDSQIAELRQGKSLADSPPGSVYGSHRQAADALITALRRRGAHAEGVLTFAGIGVDTQVVVLGGKTYTWDDPATDVDGQVYIGTTAEESLDNLIAAITLDTPVAGRYAATAMTAHPDCTAVKTSATEITARALLIGTEGNALPTTETGTNTDWAAATLLLGAAGGAGSVAERNMSHPSLQVGTGSTTTVVVLESLGAEYRIDQFRGMKVVVAAETPRIITQSDGASITVSPALSVAPTATDAVTITIPEDNVGGTVPKLRVHPGAQAGENAMLADLIDQVQVIMASYVLPV